jgi:hypothetical protein
VRLTRTPLAGLARDAPFLVSTIFMVETIFDADQNRFKTVLTGRLLTTRIAYTVLFTVPRQRNAPERRLALLLPLITMLGGSNLVVYFRLSSRPEQEFATDGVMRCAQDPPVPCDLWLGCNWL